MESYDSQDICEEVEMDDGIDSDLRHSTTSSIVKKGSAIRKSMDNRQSLNLEDHNKKSNNMISSSSNNAQQSSLTKTQVFQ